jgi:uncharacterized protein
MMRITKAVAWVACSVAVAGMASAQTIQINRDNKSIAISATDEATATADIAAVTIGFEIFGPDSDSAYAEGGKLSNAIVDAMTKTGVKYESIESTQQQLSRNFQFNDKDTPEQRAKKQFVFRQSWQVSVAPQIAAEVIRVAVAAGANQSGNIDWRLSDRKALQAKAAEAALVKARGIADRMADGLHIKLGALIYASNETPNTNIFPRVAKAEMFGVAGAAAKVMLAPVRLKIQPQIIREEATVYAVFAIE